MTLTQKCPTTKPGQQTFRTVDLKQAEPAIGPGRPDGPLSVRAIATNRFDRLVQTRIFLDGDVAELLLWPGRLLHRKKLVKAGQPIAGTCNPAALASRHRAGDIGHGDLGNGEQAERTSQAFDGHAEHSHTSTNPNDLPILPSNVVF